MILAYDLASKTGVACGAPCGRPETWTFVVAGDNAAKFSQMAQTVARHLKQRQPDEVVIEAPFVGRNANAAKVLFGFRGIVMALCRARGIPITEVSVMDARKHFIGHGGGKGKPKAVLHRCQALGWPVSGDDEADAAAVWDWACARASADHGKMTMELGDARRQ